VIIFFEFLPTVDWKKKKTGNSKILLEQSFHLRWAYRVGLVLMTTINCLKALVFGFYLFTQNADNEWLKYFYSETSLKGDELKKSLFREGGCSLIAESLLLLLLSRLAKDYRPIVLSVKDGIFYQERMVLPG